MQTDRNRRTNKALGAMLVLAGTCAGLSTIAIAQQTGAAPAGALGAGDASLAAATSPVDRAAALLDQGRYIEAKAALEKIARSGGSDAERLRASKLHRTADEKIRAADPIEVSLQRAEFGLVEGDLLAAERWAKAVGSTGGLAADYQSRADNVLADVAARRDEIRPLIPALIRQATTDFEARNYASAKAANLAVIRSGVEIDPQVSQTLENQRLLIVAAEQEQGRSFDVTATAALGMYQQPGSVRRPTRAPSNAPMGQDGDSPAAPESAPAPSGTEQAYAEQPTDPLPPMPTDQQPPVAAPPPPPPAPAPTQADVLRMAMRADAQRILVEADQAYDAARYSEAAGKYDLVIRQFSGYLDASDVNRAQSRLSDARARLESGQRSNLAGDVANITKMRREQAIAEFENELTQADNALKAGNADEANDRLARAGLVLRNARDIFPPAEFTGYQTRLDKLKLDAGTARETAARRERDQSERDAAEQAARRERDRLNERDRKVNESIDRIRALQQERKYDEALAIVDQVLFLDPNNPTGLLLKDIIGAIVVYRDFNNASAEKNQRMARLQVDNEEVMIPPVELFEFPLDWPAKTFSRGEQSAYNEPRENRQVLSDLASKRIPADFTENRLEDVLQYMQTLTGVSADIDWESLEAINVRRDTPITLKLSPLPAQTLLDRVLSKAVGGQSFGNEAGWTVDRGVLIIASKAELEKQKTLVIYNIQDLLFDIPNYTDVPEIDLNSVLQQSQGGGGGQSPFRDQNRQADDRPTREEKIRQIQEILTQNVDYQGWADNGGEVGRIQELNGSLIITNTPKNHREIVGLLSKLREIRNMQINVETKFLLVNQGWFEQIGFDIDIVLNANNNQVRAARGVDPTVQPGDFFDFTGDGASGRGLQRQVTGQGPIAGQAGPIMAVNRTSQGIIPPSRGFSPVGGFSNSLGLTSSLATSSLAEDSLGNRVLAAAPALGIAGQFLDDVQVDFLIQATQADQRSVQLTAPRLTFTNGQTANIFVVTQQAFVSDLQPIVGDSAVGFDPTVAVASEGVTMLCEGVISADRRYVTMNIDAGVARIDGFGREAVTAVAGGQLVNSADSQSFIQLPTITVTRVRTTATVPDEGTILLGGQRLVTEVEVETGVPVLSKIPIINRFFTNRVESKEEQTLLILLKPTIMIQSELEEKNFPGLMDQLRTGIGGR